MVGVRTSHPARVSCLQYELRATPAIRTATTGTLRWFAQRRSPATTTTELSDRRRNDG